MSVDEPAPALASAAERFLRALAGQSPQTRRTYASALRRFFEFLGERGVAPEVVPPTALALSLLEEYALWLVARYGRERRPTLATYLAALRAFWRFLDRRGWVAPAASYQRVGDRLGELLGPGRYRTPRIDQRVPLLVTYADALPEPPDPAARLALLRDRALLHVLFSSGMRREEVVRLDRHDLDDGHRGEAVIRGKGDKERVVFLSAEALAAVRAYLRARADAYVPLFLRHDRARGAPGPGGQRWRLSAQSVWGIVRHYAARAGVRATPHAFRHTKATVLLNRGAKLSEVQDLLGHASPETTKRIYAHYERAHLRAAFYRYSASAAELAERLRADEPLE
jgi:site-specific recombinase XerD